MHLGNYLKILLIKKHISGQGLANLLNNQKGLSLIGDGKVTKYKVSDWITGKEKITLLTARRIEIALDLEENSLTRFVNKNSIDISNYNKVFGKKDGDV